MDEQVKEEKKPFKPNRAIRRFIAAMKKRLDRGQELNPHQLEALEFLEKEGAQL